jgi:Short C-terminal domain
MKFYVRSFIGLFVFFAALAAFEYSLYQMLQVGTCASGGPYVSARQCPSGIGVYFAGLFGGIIIGLIAIGIYASRGRPPDAGDDYSGPRVPFGILAWSLLFAGTGAVAIYAVVGPDAHPGPGAKLGAIIVAIVFIPMGVIPLVLAAMRDRGSGSGPTARSTPVSVSGLPSSSSYMPPSMPTPAPPPPPRAPSRPPAPAPKANENGLAQLEKLKKLHDEGALTDAEFSSAKAKILADL